MKTCTVFTYDEGLLGRVLDVSVVEDGHQFGAEDTLGGPVFHVEGQLDVHEALALAERGSDGRYL